MGYKSYLEIIGKFRYIDKGDVVYLVSDIFHLMKQAKEHGEIFNGDRFLDTIMEVIGEEGTLLVPTFNWDFCKGIAFDYKKTKCKVGALGNMALKNDNFIRTRDPIYSFAVRGKDAGMLSEIDPSNSFGEGTCFSYMEQKNAKALVIGLPAMSGLTFMHHAEQIYGVPFRFNKNFTAMYKYKDEPEEERTYSMYVREYSMNVEEHTEPFDEIIEKLGVCKTEIYNGVPFRVLYLKEIMELLRIDILYNQCGNIYKYYGQMDYIK